MDTGGTWSAGAATWSPQVPDHGWALRSAEAAARASAELWAQCLGPQALNESVKRPEKEE